MQYATHSETAAKYLLANVRENWPARAEERIELWLPVIAEAYSAMFAGEFSRMVHVPSHIGETGKKVVEANEILRNFNNWLGGAVWDALYRVCDEREIDVAVCNECGRGTGYTGESLFPSFCTLCLVPLLEDDSDDY